MGAFIYYFGFGFTIVLVFFVTHLQLTDVVHDIDALVLLFLIFLLAKWLFLKRRTVTTASGAVVMSAGIFINGAFQYFTPAVFPAGAGKLAALSLFSLWLLIMGAYLKSFIQKDWRERHASHPIGSFAIGTWVAATSVCGTVLYQHLPELKFISVSMAVINSVLWLWFFIICLKNFKAVFVKRLYRGVHGIVLLSTVSTQSNVIFYSVLFDAVLPRLVIEVFIMIGIIFYGLGLFLIVRRYFPFRNLDFRTHWHNTNCILHGAVSITGLAAVLSKAVSPFLINGIWVWALAWFVIVELCEIYRGIVRVKTFGFSRGIGKYDVSQWARNFTFGMFFAFTMNLRFPEDSVLNSVQAFILSYGAWLILLLFINELLLFFKRNGKWPVPKNTRPKYR